MRSNFFSQLVVLAVCVGMLAGCGYVLHSPTPFQNSETAGAPDSEVAELYPMSLTDIGVNHIDRWNAKNESWVRIYDHLRDGPTQGEFFSEYYTRTQLLPGKYRVVWAMGISRPPAHSGLFKFDAAAGHTYKLESESNQIWFGKRRSDGLVCGPWMWFHAAWLKDETTGEVVPGTRSVRCASGY